MTGSVDDRTPAQVPVHEVVAVDPANCFVFVFLSLAFAVSCGRESRKDGGYIRLTLHVQRILTQVRVRLSPEAYHTLSSACCLKNTALNGRLHHHRLAHPVRAARYAVRRGEQ